MSNADGQNARWASRPDDPDARWLVRGEAGDGRGVVLYCLPPAGAGAATYRKWPGALPIDAEVRRIQPPGRETRFREPLCRDLPAYVATLARLIATEPARPFALFGHSMGALIAYEVAHAVRDRTGREPLHLFASAFRSPDAELPPPIHELPDPEFIEQLRDRFGGVPDAVLQHPEILEIMLPIVRADLALISSYSFKERELLQCPVTALGGASDHWVGKEDLIHWGGLTTGTFQSHVLAGGHFFLDSAIAEVIALVGQGLSDRSPADRLSRPGR